MRKRYKKCLLFLWILLLVLCFGGCGAVPQADGSREPAISGQEEPLKIVCTIFPEYDWVMQVLGEEAERAEVTLLLKNGSDLHSYQPTVWDMVKIAQADLFVCVGGESDFWVEDALSHSENPDRKTLNLMEILGEQVKEEEHVRGMQEARAHAKEPEGGYDGHETETEYDEHVWLSLRNAGTACAAISEALSELDGAHREIYERNCEEYIKKLSALDEEYARTVEQADCPVLLFADRFPFRYLTDDYGIEYYAAFSGCSAETEASFETMVFLLDRVSELSLPAVLAIDGSDGRLARAIAENAGERGEEAEVLILDSMQSVSQKDMEAGENYLSIMEKNLETLKKALPKTGGKT